MASVKDSPSVAEVAYAAGLFDGEGCASVVRRRRSETPSWEITVQLGMTDEVAILWLRERFGGSIFVSRSRRPRWKDCHHWRLQTRQACAFLRAIRPYVVAKAPQLAAIAEFEATLNPRSHYRHPLSEEITAERERLWELVRELNRRGRAA
jgi:hypothetical protein